MTLAGLVKKIFRSINNAISTVFKRISKPFRKSPASETSEVPAGWRRKKPEQPKRGKAEVKKKKEDVVVYRKMHHWPWIRNVKRGLAGILLLINFAISQFLISQAQGAVMAVLFFANVFIFIDYLWKTRRKEE